MADSNHTSGAAVAAVIITFTCLSCLVTFLRLYTRIFLFKSTGLDDLFIIAAAICSIAVTVTMCEQVRYGMGQHWSSLSDNDKVRLMTWFWASVWIYYGGLCLVKISILLQYLRVFPSKKFRIATFTLMFVVVVYSLGNMFSAMFICTPIRHFWDRSIDGTCLNKTAVWFSNTVLNIVTDIATTVLPLPVLRSLQLPKRQRILLMLVFGLGFTTCIISILRLYSLYIVSRTTDHSWDNPMPAIWSSAELNVAILCSCLPTLKGLISRVFPNLLSTGHTGTRSSRRQQSPGPTRFASGNPYQAQQEWDEELKSPGYHMQAFHQSPSSRQQPTFLNTESESSLPAADRAHIPADGTSHKKIQSTVYEKESTPTLTRGEDLRYMRRDPTYRV